MDSLTELLKKYYGYGANDELGLTDTTSRDGGLEQDMGLQNKSLLGSDRKTNNTLSLMGLLGSPEALTGLGLISAGMKGQGIGEAALPSFVEGLKVSSAVRTMTKEQEQQKAIDEFASQVPEQYKPLFKAFPKETMKLLLTPKTPTLSGEALKVAGKLQGLNPTEFKDAFGKLSKVEQDLYNKEIAGNQDIVSQLLAMSGGDLSKYAQTQKGTTVTKEAPVAADIKSTDIFKKYKQANPNVSDELLIEEIKKKFPNK